ncbi:MAG: Rieske (2Fe-2S) protein [Acidobacteriota bacterium]
MALCKVADAADVLPGQMHEVVRDEEHRLLLCNAEGQIHALDGICPHAGAPLAFGALHGTTIVCPWHAWEFDCRTGELDYNSRVRIQTYPVEQRSDGIYVDWD